MARIEPGLGGQVVVRHSDEVYETRDGRKRVGLHMTVSPEIFEQYRQGYRCMNCHIGVQDEPFPERCKEPFCRYPMRRDQLRRLEFEDRGQETLWPDTEPAEEPPDMWLPGQE